jgi:hypothetical protein
MKTRIPAMGIPAVVFVLVLAASLAAQPQTVQDEYALYDLQAPQTGSFKTIYDVSFTTAGATVFHDRIGTGLTTAAASDDRVLDMMTGAPLKFTVSGGAIDVQLARPVPADGGQARLRVTKTYTDAKNYRRDGDGLVFDRAVPIRHAAILLPPGYQLTECNVASQVLADADGRIRVSFMYQAPGAAPLILKAKPGAPIGDAAKPRALTNARTWESMPAQGPPERARLSERARQDRDIVYFLQEPSTHAFSLYHDYTEAREGIDKYLNVVRTGSTVSNTSGKILDTGEMLKAETLTGAQMRAAGIDAGGDQVAPDQQVVVTHFAPVKKGQSIRLRLSETYTAPQSYRVDGDEFVFERSLGRPRNSVVLPRGWYLTALSIPAVVRQTPDGLTRLDFVNGRPDSVDVLMKGKRLATK